MNSNLDDSFDKDLLGIPGLQYLPWVGKEYRNLEDKHKVLLVAESVYDWDQGSDQSYDSLHENDFARIVVQDHGLFFQEKRTEQFKNSPTYRNLERALFGKRVIDHQEIENLWSSAALHQYVQRPMVNIRERPSVDDYTMGARVLECVFRVLKPRLCIILGTDWKKVKPIRKYPSFSEVTCYDPIGRSYPRVLTMKPGNEPSKILMVRHTSKYFSWERWHTDFILKEAPEYIEHLKTPKAL